MPGTHGVPSLVRTPDEPQSGLSDEEIVERVREGQVGLFELLLRRYDQRVYRVARAVLRDDAEAEDLTQSVWVKAFEHLGQFAQKARFSTWLTRIALHEAWARARRARRFEPIGEAETDVESVSQRDPESIAFGQEIRSYLEASVEALPQRYREVFVLRDVENLSTAETAESLDLTEETVKTRLHRARAMLRRELMSRAGPGIGNVFPFLGERCDRMRRAVFRRIRPEPPSPP